MLRKISVMLVMVFILVGCTKKEVTNLDSDIFDSIVDQAWDRKIEGCGETITRYHLYGV